MVPSSDPDFNDAAQQVLELCAHYIETVVTTDLEEKGYDVAQTCGDALVGFSVQPNDRQVEQWRTPFHLRAETVMEGENPVLSITLDYPPMAAQHCDEVQANLKNGLDKTPETYSDAHGTQLCYKIASDKNGLGQIRPFLQIALNSLTKVNSARVLRAERDHMTLKKVT